MTNFKKSIEKIQTEYREQVRHWKNKLDTVRGLAIADLPDIAAKNYVQDVMEIPEEVIESYVSSIQSASEGPITVDPSERGLEKFGDIRRTKKIKKETLLLEPGKEFYDWIQNTVSMVKIFHCQKNEISAEMQSQINECLKILINTIGEIS